MTGKHQARLGTVQQTLFIPLAARAAETRRKHPVLRDPKAAEKGMDARWAWSCDDPRSLERTGLEVRQSATITRPPRDMRARLPFRYRYVIPLADPFLGRAMTVTLFRASSPAAAGPDATVRAPGAG